MCQPGSEVTSVILIEYFLFYIYIMTDIRRIYSVCKFTCYSSSKRECRNLVESHVHLCWKSMMPNGAKSNSITKPYSASSPRGFHRSAGSKPWKCSVNARACGQLLHFSKTPDQTDIPHLLSNTSARVQSWFQMFKSQKKPSNQNYRSSALNAVQTTIW